MIHDLTADGDFTNRISLITNRISFNNNDFTLSYDELVLTGTTFDRAYKQYILDYESNQNNKCHCCGLHIKTRPWDFEENKTLCAKCEKWLEETCKKSDNGQPQQEVVDNVWRVKIVKPWDMSNFERENAIDNVLLWD